MRWRSDVTFDDANGVKIKRGTAEKEIAKKDLNIYEMMRSGILDDDEILKRLSEKSGEDTISSGFRLAQFVEDYGEFLAEGEKSKVFGS